MKKVTKSLLLLAGAAMIVAAAGFGARGLFAASPLPFYGSKDFTPSWTETPHRVGEFSLTMQTGARITERDLAGRVYVASFLYTRCSAICPALVSGLKKVQAGVANPAVQIVSFSVTPELDSPEVLAEFGKARGIDPAVWKLVTGDRDQIYALARDHYFADDARISSTLADKDAFLHTEKLILVDQRGRLRGVYDGTLPRDIEHLIGDARALAKSN